MTTEIILSTDVSVETEGLLTKRTTTHSCIDGETRYTRKITELHGPERVLKRRKWAPFGEKPHISPAVGEEVFFKLQHHSASEEDQKISDCNFYCGLARQSKFNALEISAIKQAPQPQDMFLKILNENYYNIKPKKILSFKDDRPAISESKGIRSLMDDARQKKQSEEHLLTVMLDNIPIGYTMDDIRPHLGGLAVDRINVVRSNPDREQTTGGKAFVVFRTVEQAQESLVLLDGARWDHYIISAQISKPREKKI
jgi:hypothetical protein